MNVAYVHAVLEGLAQAVREGKVIPWKSTLGLAEWVVEHNDATDQWRWAKREAVRLVQEGTSKDLLPLDLADDVWGIVEGFHAAEDTWRIQGEPNLEAALSGFYGVVSHAINTPAGDAVDFAMSVALWSLRNGEGDETLRASASRVLPLLERALEQKGGSGRAARVIIGQYIPWIMLIDNDWPVRNAPTLFIGDLGGPDWDLAWGGYLTRSRLFDTVFQKLRPWYAKAVATLQPRADSNGGDGRDFAPERHLGVHIVVGLIRGIIQPGEPDRLAEGLFERAAAEDLGHAYWVLFRDFSDTKRISDEALKRLIQLWGWRLTALEKVPSDARSVGEANGLGWLFMIAAIPDQVALELIARTARISGGEFRMGHSLWDRLSKIASKDAEQALRVAELLVDAELKDEYPHFSREEVGAVLETGLTAGGSTRKLAERLLNKLGGRGFTEFGNLRSRATVR